MSKLFSSILIKLYWPTIGFFVVVLLTYIISFFYTKESSTTGSYYDSNALKMIAIITGFIIGSVFMKQQGKMKLAYLLIYGPFGLFVLAVMFFFLIAFMLG